MEPRLDQVGVQAGGREGRAALTLDASRRLAIAVRLAGRGADACDCGPLRRAPAPGGSRAAVAWRDPPLGGRNAMRKTTWRSWGPLIPLLLLVVSACTQAAPTTYNGV